MVHYIFFFSGHSVGGVGSLVDLVYFLDRFCRSSEVDGFCWCRQMDGFDGVGIHNANYVCPIIVYSFLFEHISYGIYQLISQHGQIDMGFYSMV